MSSPIPADATPVESRDQLVAAIADGCKPASEWRIGTEHEKLPFRLADFGPVPYAGESGIRRLLEAMQARLGWQPVRDGDNLIGLTDAKSGAAISLEPGGQFELSGGPLADAHATAAETAEHLRLAKEAGASLGIGFLGIGLSPKLTRAETPVMPKSRYAIMAAYMPKVGGKGLDMMFRTNTIQVNLDFGDEADMVKKMRVGLALQPVVTALFANSPFTEGRPNGFLSYRSEIWLDTDRQRTGMLPFAFQPGFGFEAYVDWALDVPMYFLARGGKNLDVAGASFRDLMAGRLPGFPGERATLGDWTNHLTTLFPEVRLKRYLEMRGADGGPAAHIPALAALWAGLLYDSVALDAASALIAGWSAEERQALRNAVPRAALKAPFRRGSVLDIARQMLAIAGEGLRRRARHDAADNDERSHLAPLLAIAESGLTPAERLLAAFAGPWRGDIGEVFRREAY
ncbi:MAG: glutamate--cysteine ligase [Bauldia sp.]